MCLTEISGPEAETSEAAHTPPAGMTYGSVARSMAVPRLRVPTVQPGGSLRQAAGLSSDEVELYHRTYTTLLRSS